MSAAFALLISLRRAETREALANGRATAAHHAFIRRWGI